LPQAARENDNRIATANSPSRHIPLAACAKRPAQRSGRRGVADVDEDEQERKRQQRRADRKAAHRKNENRQQRSDLVGARLSEHQ
jgi:hypothetical protein